MRYLLVLLTTILMLSLTACSDEVNTNTTNDTPLPSSSASSVSASAGKALFNQKLIDIQPGCITCHSLEKGVKLVGPSLAGIGKRAGTTVEGQPAEEFLRNAIIKPDDYVSEGFSAGQMPERIANVLTQEQADSLVLYLLTLQ
ncbi:c-type cytochrome [Anaerolineales bacterium HSG6]|nr:c-type cytochrome [Anaerolineales bacterium HSG6]MDM8529638.1 c-type cytochrome [Anaerolineales bacterium HSG25]